MDIFSLPSSVQGFICTVSNQCQRSGVLFQMEDDTRVGYGNTSFRVSGYFVDRPSPALKVAVGKPVDQWLGVLAHEFCHMQQWLENSPAWTGVFMEDGREAGDWLDDWIQGSPFTPERLEQIIGAVQRVEHDCERRVLEIINEFGLPLDRDTYARRANAYVHFYQQIGKTRQWYEEGRAPYEIEDLVQVMPTELVPLEGRMPEALSKAFDLHYPTPPQPSAAPFKP